MIAIKLIIASVIATATAQPSKLEKAQIEGLARSYELAKAIKEEPAAAVLAETPAGREALRFSASAATHSDHDCGDGDAKTCFNVACEEVVSGCSDQGLILAILDACRGNHNGACTDFICKGTYGNCRSIDVFKTVTEACRGNWDDRCVKQICGRVDCRDIGTATQVARSCVGN